MYPPIYALLSADSQVAPWVGTRNYPHGKAPQRVTAPYVTWDVMGGAPDNTLGEAPLSDSYVVRVRLWSEHGDAVDVFAIGAAIRDCLEAEAHMESSPVTGRDEETLRHSLEMQFRFWVDRNPASV